MVKRIKPPTPLELTEHARDLARAFHVSLVLSSELCGQPHEATAIHLGGQHFVVAQPVVDETSYAVVLHELGHCLAPLGSLSKEMRLVAERAAWEWAEYYSLDWTPAMEQVKQLSLGSYEQEEQQPERLKTQDAERERNLKSWIKKVLK